MLPADGQPGCDTTLEKNLWAGLDNNVINLVQSQADERCQIEIFGRLKLLGKNFIAVLTANPHQPVAVLALSLDALSSITASCSMNSGHCANWMDDLSGGDLCCGWGPQIRTRAIFIETNVPRSARKN